MDDPNQIPNPSPVPDPGTNPPPTPGSAESQPPSSPPQYQDWREERRAARDARREARRERRSASGTPGWILGAILIVLGILFLLQNAGITVVNNWWALFILIPAVGSFTAAYNIYKSNGRLTPAGRSSLAGGVILTLIAAVFLFGFNFGLLLPVLLIVAGLILLANVLIPG